MVLYHVDKLGNVYMQINGIQSSIAVLSTSSLFLPPNPNRRYLLIQNGSAFDIWIAFGRTVVERSDMAIYASNRAEEFFYGNLGDMLTQAVYAIAASGGSACNIYVIEGVIEADLQEPEVLDGSQD